MTREHNENDDSIDLPIVTSFSQSKFVGVILILVSSMFLITTLLVFTNYGTWQVHGWMRFYCKVIVLIMFGGPASVLFLIGLYKLLAAGEITVTSSKVVHDRRRSLFGPKRWTEPVQSYIGVLYGKERVTHGGTNSGHSTIGDEHRIELMHNDPDKCVILEETDIGAGIRRRWEQYARLLGLPAVQMTHNGLVARAIEDLDVSLSDRLATGAIEIEFSPTDIPDVLSTQICGDVLVLELEPSRIGTWTVINLLSTVIGFILIGILVQPLFILFGVAGLIGGGVGLFFHRCPKKLLLAKDFVRIARVLPWNPEKHLEYLASANIEELLISSERLDGAEEKRSATVQFVSDEKTIEFGKGHELVVLEWVRGCAASVLSAKGVL